jgi:hypothetical protein
MAGPLGLCVSLPVLNLARWTGLCKLLALWAEEIPTSLLLKAVG